MSLNYDYNDVRSYCSAIGLDWLGDDYLGLLDADAKAKALGLTQDQVNVLMLLHLWQTKTILTPTNYSFAQRLGLAVYFLTGWKLN